MANRTILMTQLVRCLQVWLRKKESIILLMIKEFSKQANRILAVIGIILIRILIKQQLELLILVIRHAIIITRDNCNMVNRILMVIGTTLIREPLQCQPV